MNRNASYEERRFRVTRIFTVLVSGLVNHLAFSFVAPAFRRRWVREGMDPQSEEFRNRWSDFTDRWVFANLVAALVCSVIIYLARNATPLSTIIALYGMVRIVEILAVQLKIVLVDPFDDEGMVRPHYAITGIQRSIVCLLFNYLEMMLWFACLMTFLMGRLGVGADDSYSLIVSANVFGCLTFDSDRVMALLEVESDWPTYLALFEAVSGMVMNVVSIGRFVGALPGLQVVSRHGNGPGHK